MSENQLTQGTLRSFQVLCEFCSRLLRENISEEFFAQLIEKRELLREEPFASVSDAAQELFAWLDSVNPSTRERILADARQDYAYLFLMVGASRTSPYESVYRTDDRTLFGSTTLEVREAYRAHGVEVAQQGSEPDDHLGTELAFIAYLCDRANKALEAGDVAEATQINSDMTRFLSDHVLVFAPIYLNNLKLRAQEPFYRYLAALTQDTVRAMAAFFGAVASEVLDESPFSLER